MALRRGGLTATMRGDMSDPIAVRGELQPDPDHAAGASPYYAS